MEEQPENQEQGWLSNCCEKTISEASTSCCFEDIGYQQATSFDFGPEDGNIANVSFIHHFAETNN